MMVFRTRLGLLVGMLLVSAAASSGCETSSGPGPKPPVDGKQPSLDHPGETATTGARKDPGAGPGPEGPTAGSAASDRPATGSTVPGAPASDRPGGVQAPETPGETVTTSTRKPSGAVDKSDPKAGSSGTAGPTTSSTGRAAPEPRGGFTVDLAAPPGALFFPDPPSVWITELTGKGRRVKTRGPAFAFSWSPDGSRLVIDDEHQICVYRDGEEGPPKCFGDGTSPSWSPVGSDIVFESDRDGLPQVYAADVDRGEAVPLTNGPQLNYHPVWSHDGDHIAWTRYDPDADTIEAWVMRKDGSAKQKLTGSNFAAVYAARDESGDFEIYALNIDGEDVRQLTNNDVDDVKPALSPDSRRVVFVSSSPKDAKASSKLFIAPTNGSAPATALDVGSIREPVRDDFPSWSPDSSQIAFVSDRGGSNDIYLVRSTGGDLRQITQGAKVKAAPGWSPTQDKLAYIQS